MLKDKDMREDQDGGGGEDDDDDWIEPTKAVGNRRKVKSLKVSTVCCEHTCDANVVNTQHLHHQTR